MKEIDLHNLWNTKAIPITNLKLTNDIPITILHFGFYNELNSGPDFSLGMIHFDGLDFVGPIELHVKSSDWYKHHHQFDPAYDNVILHVVYEHDMEIYQNGRKLPTLELCHYLNFKDERIVSNSKIYCLSQFKGVSERAVRKAKKAALVTRYAQKKIWLDQHEDTYHFESKLYALLALTFGGTVNKEGFLELMRKIPYEKLITYTQEERYYLIVNASKEGINWKHRGLFPSGFPERRIPQFAAIVSALLFDEKFIKCCLSYAFEDVKKKLQSPGFDSVLTSELANNLIMNSLFPLLWIDDNDCIDSIMAWLTSNPPENNRVVRRWQNGDVSVENAFDTQGLKALFSSSCSAKKCLSCAIGKEILN